MKVGELYKCFTAKHLYKDLDIISFDSIIESQEPFVVLQIIGVGIKENNFYSCKILTAKGLVGWIDTYPVDLVEVAASKPS